MENQKFISPSQQCSSTPVGFNQELLPKEQCDSTGASHLLSWPASTWFLSVPST